MFGSPYLFVSSTEERILEACKVLQSTEFETRYADARSNTYFFAGMKGTIPFYSSVINDQGDYSIQDEVQRAFDARPASAGTDSFVSFAHVDGNKFVAKTDFWGIQHHYFYHNERTLICSNNCFLVARLVDARIADDSMFEYLFFLSPVGDKSWFEGVRLLERNQAVAYDIASRRFSVTDKADLYEELTRKPSVGLLDAVSGFYAKAASVLQGKKVQLSLSGGSDSRTVLSGLLKYGVDVRVVSFGGEDFLETGAIRALAKARGLNSTIYDFAELLSNWSETFHSASLVTNGLLNPFRVHYGNYYRVLDGDALFEGFTGSEFVKGEIAVGGVTSECHADVIRNRMDVKQAIGHTYGFLPETFRSRMGEYIVETHGGALPPVESPAGKEEFARRMFEFVPTRVFNPLHALGSAHLKIYNPFLSPRILRTVFESYGIVNYNSLRMDFPGPVKSLVPECLIVKQFDDRLYGTRLDRQVSFKEALELPLFIVDPLRRSRELKKRLTAGRRHHGQVDIAIINAAAERYLRENETPMDYSVLGGKIEGTQLLKKRCNLICLRKLMTWDLTTMVGILMKTGRRRQP